MFSISMFLDVHTTYISISIIYYYETNIFLQVSNRHSFQKQMFSILGISSHILAIKKIIECNEKRNTHTNTYLTFVIWDAELQKNLQNADLTSLKVSKFQNCKNYFPVLQERNLYKFLFIFLVKRWLHKSILKFTDPFTTINKITQLYKKTNYLLEVRFYMNGPSKLHAAVSSKLFFGLELLF